MIFADDIFTHEREERERGREREREGERGREREREGERDRRRDEGGTGGWNEWGMKKGGSVGE